MWNPTRIWELRKIFTVLKENKLGSPVLKSDLKRVGLCNSRSGEYVAAVSQTGPPIPCTAVNEITSLTVHLGNYSAALNEDPLLLQPGLGGEPGDVKLNHC